MDLGTSELSEHDKKDLTACKELLLKLRRKHVSFVTLPTIGGASGAEYSRAQLEKAWENMRLGHKYGRKKTDVRAFVLSADLFPPNLARDGVMTTMSHMIAADPARMQSVIDFILQKRGKDDVVLLFDGRSRPCRKIMENNEDKMAASGAHVVNEVWLVYVVPSKSSDIRVPARQTSFASNNKEVVFCVVPAKRGANKIVQRAEFNSCGEISTSSPT
jgi:hypothetical protein